MSFQYFIHRGAEEIGGSCIEVRSGDTRLILDVGFPLFDRQRQPLEGRRFQRCTTAELRQHHILPPVPGLFADDPMPAPTAVIITHPHQDHYGLIPHIKPEVPIYIGKAAAKLVEVSGIFLPFAPQPPAGFRTYTARQALQFGPISITPYLVDHSAFDAYAFLVESEGTRLLYSGDFRRHGRKSRTIDWLAKKAHGVDVLLMEGTTLSRTEGADDPSALRSEADVEEKLVQEMKQSDGMALVYASAQNIDRIVSVYRAAVRTGRTLVLDVYAATVLRMLAETSPRLPHPGKFPLRVVFPKFTTNRLFNTGYKEIAYAVCGAKILWPELSKHPEKVVMLARPSMREIEKLDLGPAPLFVYSQWSGYKREESTKKFLAMAQGKGCRVIDIHVSGHAYPDSLRAFHKAIAPKKLVAIHTLVPERYPELFGEKASLA